MLTTNISATYLFACLGIAVSSAFGIHLHYYYATCAYPRSYYICKRGKVIRKGVALAFSWRQVRLLHSGDLVRTMHLTPLFRPHIESMAEAKVKEVSAEPTSFRSTIQSHNNANLTDCPLLEFFHIFVC